MQTRFTPLVKVKKNLLDRCERELQQAIENEQNASIALQAAYDELENTPSPLIGIIREIRQAGLIAAAQREIIEQKRQWLDFAHTQVQLSRKTLNAAMIEYEKFKYLEAEELRKRMAERKRREASDLDEAALQVYSLRKES